MSPVEFLAYISGHTEKINKVCLNGSLPSSVGYAIPIPRTTQQSAIMIVDTELRSLKWCFSRVNIRGQEHYILFPLG